GCDVGHVHGRGTAWRGFGTPTPAAPGCDKRYGRKQRGCDLHDTRLTVTRTSPATSCSAACSRAYVSLCAVNTSRNTVGPFLITASYIRSPLLIVWSKY